MLSHLLISEVTVFKVLQVIILVVHLYFMFCFWVFLLSIRLYKCVIQLMFIDIFSYFFHDKLYQLIFFRKTINNAERVNENVVNIFLCIWKTNHALEYKFHSKSEIIYRKIHLYSQNLISNQIFSEKSVIFKQLIFTQTAKVVK